MRLTKMMLLAAFPVLMLSCKQTESAPAGDQPTQKTLAAAKPETASFKIDGMVCAVGCAKTLEKKLAAMEGVTKVSVDFDKKEATVEFDANKQTPETLAQAVESAADGKTYKVHDVKASGSQAMVYQKEKEKTAKKKKADKPAEKKEGCGEKEEGKGCCASKKSCHV